TDLWMSRIALLMLRICFPIGFRRCFATVILLTGSPESYHWPRPPRSAPWNYPGQHGAVRVERSACLSALVHDDEEIAYFTAWERCPAGLRSLRASAGRRAGRSHWGRPERRPRAPRCRSSPRESGSRRRRPARTPSRTSLPTTG